jgi:hypothetical protein
MEVTRGNFGLATNQWAISWRYSTFAASQAIEAVVRLWDGRLQKLLCGVQINFDFSNNDCLCVDRSKEALFRTRLYTVRSMMQ